MQGWVASGLVLSKVLTSVIAYRLNELNGHNIMAWGQEDKKSDYPNWNDKPNLAKEQYPNSFDNVQPKNPTLSTFPDWDSKSQDEVLAEWEARQQLLAVAKQREMDFRKYVVSRAFPQKIEGTNNLDLANGYVLKATVRYNYKLSDNKAVEEGLDKLSRIGNTGTFIADRIVSWTPNFLLTEYRELQKNADGGSIEAKEMLRVISTFLTIEEVAPSLEIKQPKASKK